MTQPTPDEDRFAGTDQISHLHLAVHESTAEHAEVMAWFAEAKRLFTEAERRFEVGSVLPALSSLAAVPPLHRMLVDRCSELLVTTASSELTESDTPTGMYL